MQAELAGANAVAQEVLAAMPTVAAHAAFASASTEYGDRLAAYYKLQRLEAAIMQQHAQVVEARTRVEHGKLEWQNSRRKSMAFDSLSRRFDLKKLRDEANREQKAQDEMAQRGAHHHAKHTR